MPLYYRTAGVWKLAATPPSSGYPVSYGSYGSYKPSATTSGVPSGTSLLAHSGDIIVTAAGTLIDGLDVDGRILVRAANVTIQRCRVRGGTPTSSPTANTGLIDCNNTAVSNCLIRDCTLAADTAAVTWTGIIGHDYTAERNNLSASVDGFGVYNTSAPTAASGVQIVGNYVHDLDYISPDPNHSDNRTHNDGVQLQGNTGTVVRGNTLRCDSGRVLVNNTSNNGWSGTANGVSNSYAPALGSGLALTPNVSAISATIDQNWFDGGVRGIGGLCVYNGDGSVKNGVTATVTSNRFGPDIVAFPAGSGGTGGTVRRTIIFQPSCSVPGLPTTNNTTDTSSGNTNYDGSAVTVWRQTP